MACEAPFTWKSGFTGPRGREGGREGGKEGGGGGKKEKKEIYIM